MESSTSRILGTNTASQHPQRSGTPNHSPAHQASASMSTTMERKICSPSHIPVSSKQSNSPTTHWPPPKAMLALRYARISPKNHTPPKSAVHCNKTTGTTKIPALRTRLISHNPLYHQTPESSGQELSMLPRVRAWEEKHSTSLLQEGGFVGAEQVPEISAAGTELILSEPHKKSVSFSSKLPSCKRTSTIQPSSNKQAQNDPVLPEGIVLKTFTGDDEMDGLTVWTTENTPSLLDENRQLKDQVTRTNTVSTLERSLLSMKEEQQKMHREHEKAMCDMKERYQLELSRERQRLHNQILTLSGQDREQRLSDSEQRVDALEQKLAEKTAECCNLQAEMNAKKVAENNEKSLERNKTELLQAEVESLQNQLNMRQREIEEMTAKEAVYTSEKRRMKLSLQNEEGMKQQLMTTMRELASTQEQNSSLQQQTATLKRELASSRQWLTKTRPTEKNENIRKLTKMSQQEVKRLQRSLSSERQRCIVLQEKLLLIITELEEFRKQVSESNKEIAELKKFKQQRDIDGAVQKPARGESMGDALNAESRELKAQSATLRADLSSAQGLQHSLEKKVSLLQQTLKDHDDLSRTGKFDLGDDLRETHAALAPSEVQLSEMMSKCQSLEMTFSTQGNGSQINQLESEIYETKLELSGLSDKLQSEISTSTNLKEELDCCQQECSAFQDQLQLQRESAALSSKRIQQGCYKKQKQLVQRVQELQGNLKEARAAEKEAKSEFFVLMAEVSYEKAQLEKMRVENKLLSSELKEKKTLLELADQQCHEVTGRFEEEKAIQISIRTELSREVQAHLECRVMLSQHKELIKTTETERDKLKRNLSEKLAQAEQEQQNITALQLLVSQTKERLSAARQSMRQKEKEAQTRLELLKRDHQKQMKAVTLQLQELHVIRHNLQEKENMVTDLETVRETLQRECRQLQAGLDQADRELTEEIRKSSTLSAENSSLKTRLSDLQDKALELTTAQREYEDYAYKVEQTTRSEMQQMFEEVTQHIQQQSDSQKYLEKLRTENERLALKEKERQIQGLRQQSSALKQQRRQEEVLIESLKFENQLMRAQLRGQHNRGRCEVATRRDVAFSSVSVLNVKLPPIHQHSIIDPERMSFNPYSIYR